MSKTILFAGVSRVDGQLKFRGANDIKRVDQLRKLGDTDIEVRFLGREMTKAEAAQNLLDMNFANGRADIEALLTGVATSETVSKPKKSATVKVKSSKKAPVAVKSDSEIKLTPKEAERIRAEFNAKLKAVYEAN